MAEIVGLLLLALTFSVVAIATPWFRAHLDEPWMDRWMVGELVAVFLVGTGATGGALLFTAAVNAWHHRSVMEIAAVALGILVVLPVLFYASRWLGRRVAGADEIPVA